MHPNFYCSPVNVFVLWLSGYVIHYKYFGFHFYICDALFFVYVRTCNRAKPTMINRQLDEHDQCGRSIRPLRISWSLINDSFRDEFFSKAVNHKGT